MKLYNAGYEAGKKAGLNLTEDVFMGGGTHTFTNCTPGRTLFISMNFGCQYPESNGLTFLKDGNYGHHFYIAKSKTVNFVTDSSTNGPIFRLD